VVATIAFAVWDRRTIMKPFEKNHVFIKEIAKTDEKVAEALRKFRFL